MSDSCHSPRAQNSKKMLRVGFFSEDSRSCRKLPINAAMLAASEASYRKLRDIVEKRAEELGPVLDHLEEARGGDLSVKGVPGQPNATAS